MSTDSRNDAIAPKVLFGVYVLIAISQVVVSADFCFTSIGLASIQKEYKVEPATLQWFVSSWALAFGGAIILGGRLADIVGHRICNLAGMLAFAVGSFIVVIAPSFEVSIVGRVLSGLGAAFLKPAILAFISDTVPLGPLRKRIFGFYYMWNGVGAGLGLVGGGIIIKLLGWRSLYAISTLLALSGAIAAVVFLGKAAARRSTAKPDVAGAVLVTLASTLLILTLSNVAKHGLHSNIIVFAGTGTVLATIAFIMTEARVSDPIVPLDMFKLRNFAAVLICAQVATAAYSGMNVLVPTYLQKVSHFSAFLASMTSIPIIVGSIIFARVVPQILKRLSLRIGIAAGFAVLAVLAMALSQMTPVLVPAIPLTFAFFQTLGYFLVQISTINEATADIPVQRRGIASGIYLAAIDFAPALGVALSAIGLQPAVVGGPENFSAAFWILASIAIVGIPLTLWLVRNRTVTVAVAVA
jgi:MFS family permease